MIYIKGLLCLVFVVQTLQAGTELSEYITVEEICPDGFEFCKLQNVCLSTKECLWSDFISSSIECPTGYSTCSKGSGAKCWLQDCQTRIPSICDRICKVTETCLDEACEEGDCLDCSNIQLISECGNFCIAETRSSKGEHIQIDSPKHICPEGQVFCLDINLCAKDCNQDVIKSQEENINTCPEGLTYCLRSGKCKEDCTDELFEDSENHCPQGKTFCLESSSCEETCNSEKVLQENIDETESKYLCQNGFTYCLETGKCSLNCKQNHQQSIGDFEGIKNKCPIGMTFCFDSNECAITCKTQTKAANDFNPIEKCPKGEKYCVDTGRCSFDCTLSLEEEMKIKQILCPKGQSFCLETNSCEEECEDNSVRVLKKRESEVVCPNGESFCLRTQKCTKECKEESARNENTQQCSNGETYCIDLGKCSIYCNKVISEEAQIKCTDGETYCVNIGKCASECNQVSSKQEIPQNHREKRSQTCPLGLTFCLETSECSKTCENSQVCPNGFTFCIETGNCATNCLEQKQQIEIDKSTQTCQEGQTFCLGTNVCAVNCNSENSHIKTCPIGKIFCISLGKCANKCLDESHQNDEENIRKLCPADKHYCLVTNSCEDICESSQESTSKKGKICPPNLTFCLDTNQCAVDCSETKHQKPVGETDTILCPEGQIFCLSTHICSTTCDGSFPKEDNNKIKVSCPPGEIFCLDLGQCSKECSQHTSLLIKRETGSQCPIGQLFCMDTGLCSTNCDKPQNQISNYAHQSEETETCSDGEKFCLSTRKCAKSCDNESDEQESLSGQSCPSGQVFCLNTGMCSQSCDSDEHSSKEQYKRPPKDCPNGLIYCLNTGKCSDNCNDQLMPEEYQGKFKCPFGQIYCLNKGKCSDNCEKSENSNDVTCPKGLVYCLNRGKCAQDCYDESQETEDAGSHQTKCPPGQMFCLNSQKCSQDCSSEESKELTLSSVDCPIGTMFCLDSNTCSADCSGPKEDLGQDIECPDGQMLCLDLGKCAEDCNINIVRRDTSRKCPKGKIYCLDTQQCATECNSGSNEAGDGHFIPADRDIRTQMSNNRDGKKCPKGQPLCPFINACITEGECKTFAGSNQSHVAIINETCQAKCPRDLPSLGFSNCKSDDHCRLSFNNETSNNNSVCCTDTDGYQRCVFEEDSVLNKIDGSKILQSVCTSFSDGWQKELMESNSSCSKTPSDCLPGTICCHDVCWGVPLPFESHKNNEHDNSPECQNGQSYCDRTNECVSIKNFAQCYTTSIGIADCNETTTSLSAAFDLTNIMPNPNDTCWEMVTIEPGSCHWDQTDDGSNWVQINIGSKSCPRTNHKIRLTCPEVECGLITSSYIDMFLVSQPEMVHRFMVLAIPPIEGPIMGDISAYAENFTLGFDDLPVDMKNYFKVKEDKETTKMMIQVLRDMSDMGNYKFDWSPLSLGFCLKSFLSRQGDVIYGVSLENIPEFNPVTFNISLDNQKGWQFSNGGNLCYPAMKNRNTFLALTNNNPAIFMATPCASNCLTSFIQDGSSQDDIRYGLPSYVVIKNLQTVDAPHARTVLKSGNPPRVKFGSQDNGIKCGDLAKFYFIDPEDPFCSSCGLVILYVVGGSMGHWEMTNASGNFVYLESDNAIQSTLQPCLKSTSMTYRGPLSLNNCQGNCTGNDTFQVGLCPADGRLRFVRDDGKPTWSAVEALSAKIVFMVYDGDDLPTNETTIPFTIPICATQNDIIYQSVSEEVGIFYLEVEDCSKAVLSSSTSGKVNDMCGNCGGNSIKCSSCTSPDPNQMCCQRGKRTQTCQSYKNGQPKQKIFKTELLEKQCANDNSINDAGTNQCGNNCTQPNRYGLNKCGKCVARSHWSQVSEHQCRQQCSSTDCSDSSSGTALRVLPDVIDIIVSPTLAVFDLISSKIQNPTTLNNVQCWIINSTDANTKFEINEVTPKDGRVSCKLKDPPIGYFDCKCEIRKNSDNSLVDTLQTPEGKGLFILNSSDINITGITSNITHHRNYQVIFELATTLPDNVPLSGFYRPDNNLQSAIIFGRCQLISKLFVKCDPITKLAGNNYEFGLLYSPSQVAATKVNLITASLSVMSPEPTLKEAIWKNGQIIVVFVENIDGPNSCATIFDELSVELLGNKSGCNISANFIRILTPNLNVLSANGGTLRFNIGNGIILSGALKENAIEVAAGSEVVIKKNKSKKDSILPYSLYGQTQYCYNQSICFNFRLQANLGCQINSSSGTPKSEVIFTLINSSISNIWDGVVIINETNQSDNKQIFCINEKLGSGEYYLMSSVWCNDKETTNLAQNFTFWVASPGSTMVIDLGQAEKTINPDAGVSIPAKVIQCQAGASKVFRYFWGEGTGTIRDDLSKKDCRILKLDSSSTQGDMIYTFELRVIAEDTISISPSEMMLKSEKSKEMKRDQKMKEKENSSRKSKGNGPTKQGAKKNSSNSSRDERKHSNRTSKTKQDYEYKRYNESGNGTEYHWDNSSWTDWNGTNENYTYGSNDTYTEDRTEYNWDNSSWNGTDDNGTFGSDDTYTEEYYDTSENDSGANQRGKRETNLQYLTRIRRGTEGVASRKKKKSSKKSVMHDNVTGNVAEMLIANLTIRVKGKGILAKSNPQEITLGTDQPIVIDATMSEDLDNNYMMPLQFLWTCLRTDGSLCLTVVKQNESLTTLEMRLGTNNLITSVLTVPNGLLPPGEYNFTVQVSKGTKTSNSSSRVLITSDTKTPSIWIQPYQSLVNTAEKLKINAIVSSVEPVIFRWESISKDGFDYIDLASLNLKPATPNSFLDQVTNLHFDLVIPENSLVASSTYLFRITGVGSSGGVGSQDVIIQTRDGPFNGRLEITPTSGEALLTEFTLNAKWQQYGSSATDLTYMFGCRSKNSKEDILLTLVVASPEDPEVEVDVNLPYMKDDVYITVKVCNDYNICDLLEAHDQPIHVTMPSLTEKDLGAIALDAAELISQKESFAAISLTRSLVTTLYSNASMWTKYKIPVCALQFNIFVKAAENIRGQLESIASVTEAMVLLKEFTSSECFNFTDPRISDARQNASDIAAVLRDDVINLMNQMKNILHISSQNQRKKRDTTSSNGTSSNCTTLNNIFTPEELTTILKMDEISIQSLNSTFANKIQQLLDTLENLTKEELCASASMNSGPESVESHTMAVSLSKLSVFSQFTSKIRINSPQNSKSNGPLTPPLDSVTLNSSLIDLLKQLDCCGVCNGIGLFTALMSKNFIAQISNSSTNDTPIVSNIMSVSLHNPTTCEQIYLQNNPNTSFNVQLQVSAILIASNGSNNFSVRSKRATQSGTITATAMGAGGMTMKCMVYYNNAWNSDLCKTSSITMTSDSSSAVVNCECSVTGFIAVGLVDSQSQTTMLQEIYKFYQKVQFVINANSSLCLNDKTKFLSTIRTQLANFLNTDPYNFLSIDCSAGSIIVNFELVASDDVTAAQLSEAYNDLIVYLEKGILTLRDQNGNLMNVPAQCVDSCTVESERDLVAMIVGLIALFVVLGLIVCIICAVCIKKKKRAEKHTFVMPVRAGQRTIMFPPSYRDLQFAETLENTESDAFRLRRKQQGSASILLQDEGHWDADRIPVPSKYKEPSKQQLSMAVNEDMIKKIARLEQQTNH